MAKCEMCEKGIQTGNHISVTRSQISRRAGRMWRPNIRKVKINEKGTVRTIAICAHCLRKGAVERA